MDDTKEIAEVSKKPKELSSLETLGDDLAFLSSDTDNMEFYLAFRAFHEERDYEKAIEKYKAAIEYEKSNALASHNQDEWQTLEDDTLVKAMYWLGESYAKLKRYEEAIECFETIPTSYERHYLSIAAERRIGTLKAKTALNEGEAADE